MKPVHVACMTVSCGMMNEVDCYLRLDGTLEVAYRFLSFYLDGNDVLIRWSARDLLIASEYVEHREDYYKAERGFRYVLYSRGCIKPRYPMPALLMDSVVDLGQRWANWMDADIPCPSHYRY